jgi:SAM-dependent methyltransferase
MTNTAGSFFDKWSRNPTEFFDEVLREGSETFNWILSRNGLQGPEGLRRFLSGRRRILDAGCGSGRITALLRRYSDPVVTEIVGIDLVAADVARKNLAGAANVKFEQRDLLTDLSGLGVFDLIYCQEVLHHTADPRAAFLNLCGLLAADGEIAIYVYKLKAPVREYVDDYVRERIAGLGYDDAMQVCRQITELGRVLSELRAVVKVPSIPVLGIEEGEYDVQRFIYHFFMKCYWNPDMSENENTLVNYDWYHPHTATRHTLPEVEGWFKDANLKVVHTRVDPYGITVRGVRC